jgi:hypothetical protein
VETFEGAREKILTELKSDDGEVRTEFQRHFAAEVSEFADHLTHAFMAWQAFDNTVQDREDRAVVSALVYSAITLHLLSMKLFLSGLIVAAGALSRQVVESIALSLLCSRKDLGVLDRFWHDRYSANDAVTHVARRCTQLAIKLDSVKALQNAQHFYHKYSHISKFTIAAGMSFAGGELYVGASFDKAKLDSYVKEMKGRVSLSSVLSNFVDRVAQNVAQWE